MAITTIANLRIDAIKSDFIPFVTLELEQFIADHARVKIKIDLETFNETVLSKPMERIALLNERFHISVQTIDESGSETDVYDFLGLISDTQIELDAGQHGWMYIYGNSRSIELERGRFLRSHADKQLNEIVDRVTKDKVYVQVVNDPEYKTKIDFSMQYYETDYQYLARLAWMYGEKLVFNGNCLIFGKIPNESTTKITYNKELVEVKLNSRMIANRFKQYYHTLEEEKVTEKKDIDEKDTFTKTAATQSHKLNQLEHLPEIPIVAPVNDDGSLKKLTEIRKKATMNRMFYVSGKTNEYKVTIGELLEIDFDDKMIVDESVGTLRVTRTLHFFDQNRRYYNEFEACQQAYDYFPYEDFEMPVAQPLTAVVKNNQDEKKLGRVQLQFDFEEELCQFWFRCSTIDAGGNYNGKSTGIQRNKGINFVPDLEDRVYVAFMEGNPDKPFIAGSFFHGSNAEELGGGADNPLRFIRDKSGTEIVFNDKEGSIHIKDKNDSDSKMTYDGNQNIILEAGKSLSIKIAETQSMLYMDSGGNISITGTANISLTVGGSLIELTPNNISISGETIDVFGSKNHIKGNTDINGGNVRIN